MDTLLPAVAVPDPKAGQLDPQALAPEATEVWLEIGFGGGEHMAAQAARRPDALVIGCEPFLNGVASALRHIDEQGLKGDPHPRRRRPRRGRRAAGRFGRPGADPVPRPLAQGPPQQAAAAAGRDGPGLRPHPAGGTLRFVTDWLDYAEWALERLERTPGLQRIGPADQDWFVAPADHVVTRYEEKKLGGLARSSSNTDGCDEEG